MTTQQFNVLEGLLQEKGYRFNKGRLTSEDFYYYKTFGKGDNPYEEGRSNYQILFRYGVGLSMIIALKTTTTMWM